MEKIGLVSLGCAKNLVDSEIILGMFERANYPIVNDAKEADIIIVNTCGFISESKKESIDVIFQMAAYQKPLIVIGCLVERYYEDLKKSLPEADLLVRIKDYPSLHLMVEEFTKGRVKPAPFDPFYRLMSTQDYSAYLRISEGCNHRCSYCAIPLIRGQLKSRPLDEIIKEAKHLSKKGIKEIIIIAQDTTSYGFDLGGKHKLIHLLEELLKFETFLSIRLLYLYPEEISDDLIIFIKNNPRVVPYFDIPIQHASNRILKLMNRHSTKEEIINLINKIRHHIPHAIIRSTYIVGFPSENEEDFNELLEFTKLIKFNHLGVFPYSQEEDTPSYSFLEQVDEDIKRKRLETIIEAQQKISYRLNTKLVGTVMEGFITHANYETSLYQVRTYFNAPDDVDGRITLSTSKKLQLGDYVKIKIIAPFVYDLYAELYNDH